MDVLRWVGGWVGWVGGVKGKVREGRVFFRVVVGDGVWFGICRKKDVVGLNRGVVEEDGYSIYLTESVSG